MSSKSDGNAPKELTSGEIKIINTFRSVSSSVKKLYKSIIFRRVFIAASLIFILGVGIPTSYSLNAKHIGNELYKNAEYSESLEQYLKAKEWWVLEKIALRFYDRDLYNKIDKANVMIKSEEYYKNGLQAFSDRKYQEAINYFSSMAERDPNIEDAQSKIFESNSKIEEEENRVKREREKEIAEELGNQDDVKEALPTTIDITEKTQACPKLSDSYATVISLEDSLGNIYLHSAYNECFPQGGYYKINNGDSLTVKVNVGNKSGDPVLYQFVGDGFSKEWQKNNSETIKVSGKYAKIHLRVFVKNSDDRYRAPDYDDMIQVTYTVE